MLKWEINKVFLFPAQAGTIFTILKWTPYLKILAVYVIGLKNILANLENLAR